MERPKGSAYAVARYPLVTKETSCQPARARKTDKTSEFYDLRESVDRGLQGSCAKSCLGTKKPPLLHGKTKNSSDLPYQSSTVFTMPSAIPNGLKRCQSASTIRKKLQNAVDQSAHSQQDNITMLRALGGAATTKPPPKSVFHQQTQGCTVSSAVIVESALLLSRKQVRENVDRAVSVPSFANMFVEANGNKRAGGTPASFKARSSELEVHLAEQLNEIERSKLREKAESRFRASQRVFDHVIQRDEAFGQILASLRDEYEAYIKFLRRRTPCTGRNPDICEFDNQSRDLALDAARVQQENMALRKQCAMMKREIEVLQASVITAAAFHGAGDKKNLQLEPQDDWRDDDFELSDVPLLPLDDAVDQDQRPSCVPQLDFARLSPYNEEEDEDADEGHYI